MLRKLLDRLSSRSSRGEPGADSATNAADHLIEAGSRAETAGDLGGACALYRKAVTVAPGYARAQLNLGACLEAIGDTDGALRAYESAFALDPANAQAAYNIGRLLFTRGMLTKAADCLRLAIARRPDFPEALVVLAGVQDAQDDPAGAAASLELGLRMRPDWIGALTNYAGVLGKLGRVKEAERVLRHAVSIEPGNADVTYELGAFLHSRGALQEAEKLLLAALKERPGFPEAYGTLFHVYEAQGKLDAAAAALEAALSERPDWTAALVNYGSVLRKLVRLDEAEAAVRRAAKLEPQSSFIHQALALVLLSQSRVSEALEILRVARKLDPERWELESAELYTLGFSDEITTEALFQRHRDYGERLERAFRPCFEPFQNVLDPGRRLRIGYLSGDFGFHVVALFLSPVVERHDRSAYEVYCYSVGPRMDTGALRVAADVWREAASLSHQELANAINRDKIDILVDLSGHSGETRLPVFALQPAPVQVTWLGYLATTGTTRIQYRLCDKYSDPPGMSDQFHTESLVRLPHSQWCYRPLVTVEPVTSPPFARNGYITFGSFNQAPKLSPTVRKLWADILRKVPGSRLVVVGVPAGHCKEALSTHFREAGIEAGRIKLVERIPLEEYFRWYNQVDIALDSFPYSGGTTTCDAVWMGVPVITVPGTRSASRSTASILSTLGLADWIAEAPQGYVELAVRFATDIGALISLRKSLRDRVRGSALMDEERFARNIEAVYRRMWQAWCEKPTGRSMPSPDSP